MQWNYEKKDDIGSPPQNSKVKTIKKDSDGVLLKGNREIQLFLKLNHFKISCKANEI